MMVVQLMWQATPSTTSVSFIKTRGGLTCLNIKYFIYLFFIYFIVIEFIYEK
jgi:hypothetical protein